MEKIMDGKKLRNLIISVALFALGWVLPGMGNVTKEGMFILGTFVSLIYAMASGVEAWYVLLLLLVFGFKNGLNITTQLVPTVMGNYIVWFIIFTFWYMAGVQRSGFLNFITRKLLGLKLSQKGPYWLMSLILIATYVAAALTQSSIAILFLMLAVLRGVKDQLDLKINHPWLVAVAVSVGLLCFVGGLFMPFNFSFYMYSLIVASTYSWAPGVNAIAYTLHQLIAGGVVIALMVAVTKFIIRPKLDFGKLAEIKLTEGEEEGKIKFDKAMGAVVATLVVLVVVIGLPSIIKDQTNAVYKFLSNANITAGFALSCAILMFVRNKKGERCLDFGEVIQKATPWAMIVYIAAIIYLGDFISQPDYGIMAQVAVWCAPLGKLSPVLVISLLGLLAILLTNATNNIVVALLLAPIGFAAVGTTGPLAAAMVVMVVCGSLTTVALPSGGTSAIVLHTQKDLFTPGKLILYGYVMAIMYAVAYIVGYVITQGLY